MVIKDLFPICRFLFCPIDIVLCITDAFQFYEVPFVYSLSKSLSYCFSVQEIFCCAEVFEDVSHFLFYWKKSIWFYVEIFDALGLEFVQANKNGSIYILLHADCHFSQHYLLNMLSLSTGWFWLPLHS